MNSITRWWRTKWQRQPALTKELLEAYRMTFRSPHGELVLSHMLEKTYCTVYEGTDAIEAATWNGRRAFVQDILENIESAERGTPAEPANRDAPTVIRGAYGGT